MVKGRQASMVCYTGICERQVTLIARDCDEQKESQCLYSVPVVKNTPRDLLILTYAIIAALATLLLFLYGFFPIKYDDNAVAGVDDIPSHVEHVRVKTAELYRPQVKKVVILVIDALRWDFVTGPIGIAAMPLTNHLIKNSSNCLMQARASPPTVTMPRIKAMMTGAVPSFIDVALNFGDLPVSGDSLILQAKNRGHNIHFYGDDTWLKIFPNMFEKYEGTTSFFVTDFTEVDNNVTRHISKELNEKEGWSMLILHYLGLDHIGHVAGPFSPLIKPKLEEMDRIIGEIHRSIQSWNESGLPALLVICGDHGMKDSGGHGGSTPQETLVPFLTFGLKCASNQNKPNQMSQVDIAPTLSIMLGIPIPSSNVGGVPLNILNGFNDSSKLFVLYYNSRQVFNHFSKLNSYETTNAYEYYTNAIELHVDWLNNRRESSDVDEILILYNKALQEMKETLIHSMIEYDLQAMTIATIFMAHVRLLRLDITANSMNGAFVPREYVHYVKSVIQNELEIIYILANVQNCGIATLKKRCSWILGSFLAFLLLRFSWEAEKQEFLPINIQTILLTTIVFGFFVLNSNLCAKLSLGRLLRCNLREWAFPLGMLAHVMSLISSSFVEEEHQTWYFYWTTFLIILFSASIKKRCGVKTCGKILLMMLSHRVLRKLNSTGNKYAHLPDIAGWLRNQQSNEAMTAFLLIALGVLLWIGYRCEDKPHRNKTLFIHSAAAFCIYLRHMANGAVAKFYIDSRGIIEVQIFWILILIYTIYFTYRLCRLSERKAFVSLLLRFIVQLWVILSSILHRPHNVLLLPIQLICSSILCDALGMYESGENAILYAHIWMGNVFYFYQGNSNSLATIDVAAGYVGLESYQPVITGIFMSINTYSAPVLAYFTLLAHNMSRQESYSYSEKILSINRRYAFWRFLPTAVYTFIVSIQRFHLFVWTVFSPKLLYEAMHCAVLFTLILSMNFLGILLKNKR